MTFVSSCLQNGHRTRSILNKTGFGYSVRHAQGSGWPAHSIQTGRATCNRLDAQPVFWFRMRFLSESCVRNTGNNQASARFLSGRHFLRPESWSGHKSHDSADFAALQCSRLWKSGQEPIALTPFLKPNGSQPFAFATICEIRPVGNLQIPVQKVLTSQRSQALLLQISSSPFPL